jgi:hypothetical protein
MFLDLAVFNITTIDCGRTITVVPRPYDFLTYEFPEIRSN